MKNEITAKRLQYALDQANMKAQELADRSKVNKASISQYINGTHAPSNFSAGKMGAVLDVDPVWLMGYDVPMKKEQDTPLFPNIHPIGIQRLPVVGSVACGEPKFADEEISFYVDNTTGIPADFVLIAHGDSMIGARINDGDLVFIRKQSYVDDGDIAAVIIDDDATLKRIYHYGDLLVLRADNPAYKDIVISPKDGKTVAIMGKAVAFQSDVR